MEICESVKWNIQYFLAEIQLYHKITFKYKNRNTFSLVMQPACNKAGTQIPSLFEKLSNKEEETLKFTFEYLY